MSSTLSLRPEPTNFDDILNNAAAKAIATEGISLGSFFASLSVAAIVFLVQFIIFLLIRNHLARIYKPRTFLVPESELMPHPPRGPIAWLHPVFKTSDRDFLVKCGMDAYFFIRYLRTLLKIFVTLAAVILPILIPLNLVGGRGPNFAQGEYAALTNVTGLDQLAFGNIRPDRTRRYWAHLILAVTVVLYVCYIFFEELRGFVRLRQHYLTTPQHRLRASATTVLVTGIPQSWLTVQALEGLYDVFPGGVRRVWLNRNFDELSDKVIWRNRAARRLEAAETDLVIKAKKAHIKQLKRDAKKDGRKPTDQEMVEWRKSDNAIALRMAQTDGTAAGDPHQVKHTVYEATHDAAGHSLIKPPRRPWLPVPVLDQRLQDVTRGFNRLGQTVRNGLTTVQRGVESGTDTTGGFDPNLASPDARPAGEGMAGSDVTGLNAPSAGSVDPAVARGQERSTMMDGAADGEAGPRVTFAVSEKDTMPPVEKEGKAAAAFEKAPYGGHGPDPAGGPMAKNQYPPAYDEKYETDATGEPTWSKYLKAKDRETMRVPPFGESWLPPIPLFGKKVDTIYHLRKLVARLNVEIEMDQKREADFPLMNSAFVQFNSQIAAHMACQSVSHHTAKHMAPRLVEISPDDIVWNNMSLRWWERYVRTALIVTLVVALAIGWAIPVTFTGLLSQVRALTTLLPWLRWINDLPRWAISLIQGVLPQAILAALMALLPFVLRALSSQQGIHTGNGIELSVQNYFFIFLFVQVFLIVSISSGVTSALRQLIRDVASAPSILAINLPRASNYFFSYMLLQAFSVSSGALLQLGGLFNWFILGAMDTTARQRWSRQMNLPTVQWGTFFPIYTNLAAIGLIYSVISPLILIFNIITFALFWVAYRYNTLYVTKNMFDTGGLLYPRAINQLFTGLYVMELCMIGLFFLVRDTQDRVACRGQAIVMIIVTIFTAVYQYLLNEAFGPLFKYIPVSLEDNAAERERDFHERLLARRREMGEDEDELESIKHVRNETVGRGPFLGIESDATPGETDEERSRKHRAAVKARQAEEDKLPKSEKLHPPSILFSRKRSLPTLEYEMPKPNRAKTMTAKQHVERYGETDAESQRHLDNGRALFLGLHDKLEDLTEDERDWLVTHAFRHEALRAKRPVVWIPRDTLGVSDDEVHRTQLFSKNIWISNQHTGLDSKCKVVFGRSPPDFSELDLIRL